MADKNLSDKFKESLSFKDLDGFGRKYLMEIFTVLALAVAAISSAWDFFTGPRLSIFVFALGAIVAIFFPEPIRRVTKKMYRFTTAQEQTTQLILGVVRVVVGIFIPFVLFGAFGLLSGLAFHYYAHKGSDQSDNQPKLPKAPTHFEHD